MRPHAGALATLFLMVCSMVPRGAVAVETCPFKLFRWEEDCSVLREQANSLTGLGRLRFLPLNDSGSVWLTLGAEYRIKTESLRPPDYGLKPVDQTYTAVGQRLLMHLDLRSQQGWRVFVQLAGATDTGRKPAPRPFDRTDPDVAQAFVEVPLLDAAVLRLGRQELDAGGNRLVSVREGANLRLAFDMAHLESSIAGIQAVAFYGRPVLNRPGAFDDRRNHGEWLAGGWLQRALGAGATAAVVNVFFLARDRTHATYEQGAASDDRRTAGIRVSGSGSRWDYAIQAARQYGSFGGADIDAFGVAGDVGWHATLPGSPRIAVSFGYASGDARPGDHRLGTFDVLYPNLGYFSDAPVFYPGNTADTQPNVTVTVAPGLTFRGGADVIFRTSRRDAVYGPPGLPALPGTGAGPSYVTTLSYIRTDWNMTPHVGLALSFVHGDAGKLIRSAGGRAFNYGEFVLDLRI